MKYTLVKVEWIENAQHELEYHQEIIQHGLDKPKALSLQFKLENKYPEANFLIIEEVDNV